MRSEAAREVANLLLEATRVDGEVGADGAVASSSATVAAGKPREPAWGAPSATLEAALEAQDVACEAEGESELEEEGDGGGKDGQAGLQHFF